MGTLWQQLDAVEAAEEYKASEADWSNFVKSRVWEDMKFYISDSIEIAKDLLTLPFEERSIKESDESLRGGVKVLKRILYFPHEMLKELENDRRRDDPDGGNIG